MKLRHRLFLFSTGQLVAFGVVFGLAFWAFQRKVMPMLQELLREKSESLVMLLSKDFDLALAAQDPKLMVSKFESLDREPDFEYVVVRDATGATVAVHGSESADDVFAGPSNTATVGAHAIVIWAPISLEGLPLGSVGIALNTTRFATLARWARWLALGVTVSWLVALGYSIVFARSFVSPIRAMMDFSREVAGGELSRRLEIAPPGELRDLRDYLNQMTAELEHREQARKIAAGRTEEMQRELLAMSRMAGMAEVATGVLHNVGNVLNSLNISVSLIDERVRNSRVAGLAKATALFDAFPGGLPAFLETAKGKVLPGYLASAASSLLADNACVVAELTSVTRNVDHIKSIVAVQQAYARPSSLSEPILLASLIDDALRMGASAFAKHSIEIIKDYADDVSVVSDRHKLLQILINLISNSRHALADGGAVNQRLTVSVRAEAPGVMLAITDTGVGIPAENLARIFEHGFTTKQQGHGFGLHASANAARELGGTLVASSAGPGTGATFTLAIPSTPTKDADHV